jgi:pSer/pThr/pTyr-binding forkhead associated (FHA) protein
MLVDQRLRVMSGPDKGNSFQLPQAGSETLGRSRQHNEICLHDPAIARVHCQVEIDDGHVFLSDFDSETGTFLNGTRITRQELTHGDVIRIGDTELQFQSIGGAPSAAAIASKQPPAPPATSPPSGAATLPTDAPAPAKRPSAGTQDLASLSGATLSHFELGPVIGTNHYGTVFRARDRKEDRIVALKVLAGDFPKTESESQQFVQTIKTALSLRHPNLVAIYSAGRSTSHYWIAMEHVEGETPTQMLQWISSSGAPDWRQAFRLAVHLARALYFIHENQLLHGNITPDNILCRSVDKQTKLAGLLFAKALAGSSLRRNVLRAKLVSELPYLSPEQTVPNAVPDARSDIYSVGAVAYHLLTGKPPFAGNSPAETISMVREARPAAPKQANPSTPAAFELIVLRMLAKPPSERHQTAAELLSELSRIAPEPVG